MRHTSTGRTVRVAALAGGMLLIGMGAAHAAYTEEKCQADRAKAAGKYANCAQKAMAKLYSTDYDWEAYNVAAGKCVTKYAATWPKLQGKAAGTGVSCDHDRFDTSVPGTVIDRLTGLQWEKKTDDGTAHDKDNVYTWTTSADGNYTDADGTAFTSFLAALNNLSFAGQGDWRLPTRDELLTIVTPAYPACTSGGPCIDPVFGLTVAYLYWSATTHAPYPNYAWYVNFYDGFAGGLGKGGNVYVRAVRAGL